MASAPDLTAAGLRATFDAVEPFTVGLEEEVMVLDPETLDLAPDAQAVLGAVDGDPRFLGELPAAQVELLTPPAATAAEAIGRLRRTRSDLLAAAGDRWRFASAGLHPFAAPEGELNEDPRYEPTRSRFGAIARQQLVFALHVHVAVGGAERTLAVYNALRSYLPDLSALAANSVWHDGRDTGFASFRPMIGQRLPRQGVPPALTSWDDYAEALRWGDVSGRFQRSSWWWELRPHPLIGTLEVRAPDAQATIADTAGVVALVHALVKHLAALHDAGEALPVASSWRITENRWDAARAGLGAELADLDTGAAYAVRERVRQLIDELPVEDALADDARALAARNGAERQAALGGAHEAAVALADGFSPSPTG